MEEQFLLEYSGVDSFNNTHIRATDCTSASEEADSNFNQGILLVNQYQYAMIFLALNQL